MDEEIITKAIDEAFTHSRNLEKISISFYGGEPLIAWNLLKIAVSYAQASSANKQVQFSMTTNATLVDREKARFLREAGFSILVSLDGPQFLHDQYRVYPTGRGSYRSTIKGLRILLDEYPTELHHLIGLNMVVPSFSWVPYLEKLWGEEPWLPRTLRAQASVVNAPKDLPEPDLPLDLGESYWDQWLSAIDRYSNLKTTLGKEMFDDAMANLHQRPRFKSYRSKFYPNGCCIPGARRIFVQSGGSYQICERVHGAPTIGSVKEGVDLSRIKEIVEEYSQLSFLDCKKCFAISICTLCFMHAYENKQINIGMKRLACNRTRGSLEDRLRAYGYLSQAHPYKLDEWDEEVFL